MALGSIGSFVLRISNNLILFLTGILLARLLGANEFGLYVFAMAWVNLLSLPAALGLNEMLVHQVAAYRSKMEWAPLKGLLWRAALVVLGVSILLAFISFFALQHFYDDSSPDMSKPFLIALTALPFWALAIYLQGALCGLGQIIRAQLPLLIIRGSLLIVGVVCVSWVVGNKLTANGALLLNGLAILLAVTYAIYTVLKHIPVEARKVSATYHFRYWLSLSIPFLLISIMRVLGKQVDILLLGILLKPEATGIYSIVRRGAELTFIPIIAISATLGPVIAQISTKGDNEQLKLVVMRSSRMMLLTSLSIGIGLLIFSNFFLSLYGEEFIVGTNAFAILIIGALLSIATGPVVLILMMTGHSRDAAMGTSIGAILSIVLNLLLIPRFNAEGAALATSISQLVMNLFMSWQIFRKLNISSFAFNFGTSG